MSADNYIGVWREADDAWHVEDGSMSCLEEDCQYRGLRLNKEPFPDRATALVFAHDKELEEAIIEYGVIELGPCSDKRCGECYVCTEVLTANS